MNKSRKAILVTDAERGSALSVIRCVARAGYKVFATSKTADAVSFRSRYVAGFEVCPDPHTEPKQFSNTLLELVQRFEIDLLVPITEESILPLADERARFEQFTTLAVAESDALAVALNKRRTLECAEELGIPCPKTHFVASSADLQRIYQELQWPVVVKPQFSLAKSGEENSAEECKISYASNRGDIEGRLHSASGRYGFLLQDYCGGRGVGIELLVWNGVIQSAFQHVRLAEVPTTGGASALRKSVAPDPQLLEYSARLVGHLGWTGLCMIEFRGEGTAARLMEMNGRVWGSLPLAVQSGMDFPGRLAQLTLGDALPNPEASAMDSNYRNGHIAYNPDLLAIWFGSVLRGKISTVPQPSRLDALRLIPHCWKASSDLYDPADPAPARGTWRRLIRKVAGKLVHRETSTP